MKLNPFLSRTLACAAMLAVLNACGGGGGSSENDGTSSPPPTPFDSGTPADSVKSVALTALVETLYSATGYLVDDSVAYRAAYASSPSDPDGKVTVSKISCSGGSYSVVADPAANASYSEDDSVLYQLSLDAAGCQLPVDPKFVPLAETGGVMLSEGYDAGGLLLNYSYGFGSASTDLTSTGSHLLTASVGGQSISSSTGDVTIDGSRNGTASSATLMEQIDGTVIETKAGVAANLGFTATFTRVLDVQAGQPVFVSGPADPASHFAIVDDATWGDESCLTAVSHSVLDLSAPMQLRDSGDRLALIGGAASGELVTDLDDAAYDVSITFASNGIAQVKVVDSASVETDFNFDTNALLASSSICGGSAAFWQQAGRRTPLAKRLQGS